MKYLYKQNNNKKIEAVLCKYNELAYKTNNKTNKTLLLVSNSSTKLKYERRISLDNSESVNINTYLNFVKKEIIKYWPIISTKCKKVKINAISPRFINSSLSEYIINEKVNNSRHLYGYFNDMVATDRSIAKNIYNNINKSALSLIEFETIGEKIYNSKKNKDTLMRFSYSQMDEVIKYYVDTLLSNAILDNSLCIYVYNNYLLNDKNYLNKLNKEIDYLIVDSLESCSPAEVDFINKLFDLSVESHIYYDTTRDYASFNNIDLGYIKEKIIQNCDIENERVVERKNTYTETIDISHIYSLPVSISLSQSSQLYSEMVEEVCKTVVELIDEGISPNEIAIISPVNNTVLDYQVKYLLSNHNIKVANTKKDKKLVDYPYSNALVVASCIFYGYEELIKEEEYISFIETLMEVNRIKANKIYKNKEENDKLKSLKEYMIEKRNKDIKIDEFLIKFYIDKMLSLKYGRQNVNICKQIINESESFVENISLLKLDKEKSKEEIFIRALKTSINDYHTATEIDELLDSDNVIMTTPYTYISNNINKPIQLWVDIGSNSWNMKIEKELSNNIVLRKSFDEKSIYSDDMEEKYKRYYLYNMIYTLLYDCKKVYAFKSDYTVNGYIQESILYSLLLKVLDKGDNNE